jgi:hypothetical protein
MNESQKSSDERGTSTDERRQFLRTAVRYPLLGAIGILGFVLLRRGGGGRPVEEGQDCVNRGLCRGCRVLPGCSLPQATMARDVIENGRRFL